MDELDELTFQYNLKFDEGFPMFQLCRGRSDEECKAIVQRCLDENKTAYELGLVTDEEGVYY